MTTKAGCCNCTNPRNCIRCIAGQCDPSCKCNVDHQQAGDGWEERFDLHFHDLTDLIIKARLEEIETRIKSFIASEIAGAREEERQRILAKVVNLKKIHHNHGRKGDTIFDWWVKYTGVLDLLFNNQQPK